MPRIEAETGHRGLYVKRDDAMSLGLGGNKVRSLEFWIGEAMAAGADTLLVAGRAVSNQCRLTAAAAARLGLGCVVVHNDDPPPHDEGNLLLSRLYGADIRFVGPVDEDERGQCVEEVRRGLEADGRTPYVVGEPVTGALGYVAAALELREQALESGTDLRHVVLPGSMGTTEAGFLFGNALLGGPFTVHLVSVEYEVEELARRIEVIYRGLSERTGDVPRSSGRTQYYGEYLGQGYARPTPEALLAIRRLAAAEALLLETTYTAKPFAALLDLVERCVLPPDEPVCAIHTGGLPALFAQTEGLRVSGVYGGET
jgi:1-aminocyclopropane-1-carboxylate deaminase/D-cysteine desulfhydrase-like pyridoxal-dependent ACC family enzyme